jgi:hypothetical protein
MPGEFVFGKPYNKSIISGVETQQYRIASNNTDVPIYGFTGNVGGISMNFEIVSCAIKNSLNIYEEPPMPGTNLAFLYRDDGGGSPSTNTGFFSWKVEDHCVNGGIQPSLYEGKTGTQRGTSDGAQK